MANRNDRFYLLEFRNRPVQYGDVGSLLRINGLVVSGGGLTSVLMLPSAKDWFPSQVLWLTAEEWSDFIHRSDDPEILVGGPDGNTPKIFQRKLRYEVSSAVQQKVWAADGFKCMYCGSKFGDVLMTIDHFVPLEMGGVNDATNYLSSCKKCNKDKASESPETWCERNGYDYDLLQEYLRNRKL